MNTYINGVTDLPRDIESADLLNTDAYAKGLCAFIYNCPTPMSIALQGDWGTGKTSIMNYIMHTMEGYGIKTINVNTWQYSQIRGDDKLITNFMLSLLNGLDADIPGKITKDIAKTALVLGKIAVGVMGGDLSAIDDLMKDRAHGINLINELRKNFQSVVSSVIEKHNKGQYAGDGGRLVILVDDLDRLNPNVAVELLEAIKLFLDVERCVFVLSIDYEVVVQGVREKFGRDVPLEKCRSFFDKIVQLPFHMPVETYKLDKMVEAYLSGKIHTSHMEVISQFAADSLGANPRTFKRLVNAFLLLELIQKELNQSSDELFEAYTEKDNAILFCVLCIQIRFPALYSYLSNMDAWSADSSLLRQDENDPEAGRNTMRDCLVVYTSEKFSERSLDQMVSLLSSLEKILSAVYGEKTKKNYIHLRRIIKLSAVTGSAESVQTSASTSRSTPILVIKDTIETRYESAADAFVNTAREILLEHSDMINECANKFKLFLTRDPRLTGGSYGKGNAKRYLENIYYSGNEEEEQLYIGTASSTDMKCSQIRQLCSHLRVPEGSIIWKEAENTSKILFSS